MFFISNLSSLSGGRCIEISRMKRGITKSHVSLANPVAVGSNRPHVRGLDKERIE